MITATQRGARMTLAEYLALEGLDDGVWELVDGVLEKMPAASLEHQHLIGLLYWLMRAYLTAAVPAPGLALQSVGVALSQFRVAVPDLVYVRAERGYILGGNLVEGIPDLVVEALSQDRARDLVMKRGWYEAAGIPEYWILDPVNDTITVLELAGGRYVERAVLGRSDILTTAAIPGFALPLGQIFDDPARVALSGRRQ